MNTYNISCTFANTERTVAVQTDADLNNCDADMLACEIEACLAEQHGIDIETVLQWEFLP